MAQGHTIFALPWRNPDASDRSLDLDDCRRLVVMAAPDAIGGNAPAGKAHGVGCCLGGRLLSIAAAAMAGDDRLASPTLLAVQVDSTEPGELTLFIGPRQLYFLESMMWNRGYLKIHQFTDCEVIFALTSGGHDPGILSPPGHPRRSHRIAARPRGAPLLPAAGRTAAHPAQPGSWWEARQQGLAARSGAPGSPPARGRAPCDAPGTCVFQR